MHAVSRARSPDSLKNMPISNLILNYLNFLQLDVEENNSNMTKCNQNILTKDLSPKRGIISLLNNLIVCLVVVYMDLIST